MSYCLGGLPKTPPAYIFTFKAPFEHLFTLSAQAAKILLAMNAFGGSKVANFNSVAEAELIMPKEKIPKTIPINFFHINFPLLKII